MINPDPVPTLSHPPQPPAPTIQTRPHLEAAVENIARLHAERAEIHRAQEAEIAAIRRRHRAPLAEVEAYLELETAWVETWARTHPTALGPERMLHCAQATLGFRRETPRLERASRRWTWSRIAVTLATLPWGRRYLRIPEPEVDKDAILRDLPHLSLADLRDAGLRVIEGEHFFLQPQPAAETNPAPEPEWRQAA